MLGYGITTLKSLNEEILKLNVTLENEVYS